MKKVSILSLLIGLIIGLSSQVGAANSNLNFTVDNKANSDILELDISGEKERKVIVLIRDDNKTHFMDEIKLDLKGKARLKLELEKDKKYDFRLSSDGSVSSKNGLYLKQETIEEEKEEIEEPKIKTLSLRVEGYRGTILSQRNIAVEAGESVMDLTKRILEARNISYKEKNGYILSIDGQAEFDKGQGSGWMFTINGKFPNRSADDLRAKDFKRVEWKYTYDFGKDIGADKNWLKIEDKFANRIDELLKLLGEEDINEKDVLKNLKDLSKEIEKIPGGKRLNYGERIYDSLKPIQDKFKSEDIASKIGEIILKIIKEINKDIEDEDKTLDLFGKYLGLANTSLERIKSESERKTLVEGLVRIISKLERESISKNLNKNKLEKSMLRINFDHKNKLKLNQDLLLEIKKQAIERLAIVGQDVIVEVGLDDLKEKIELEISRDKILIKTGNSPISFKYPVKIKIRSLKKNKVISVNDEIVGGLANGKEVLAYSNKLGQLKLEDRKPFTFYDLGNYSWAKEAIDNLTGNQVVTGRNKDRFDPGSNITRGEFSALVTRMLKLEASSDNLDFKDVKDSDWYYTSIKALNEKGYINGRSRDVFDPNGNISREEMAKILGQILKDYDYKDVSGNELNRFIDSQELSSWARPGAAIVVKNEALKGSNGNFNPKNKATRAETVTLLYRTYKLIMED